MNKFKEYFENAIEKKASDLHLVGGEIAMMRVNGELLQLDDTAMDNQGLELLISNMIGKERYSEFQKEKEYDFVKQIDSIRFRANIHCHRQKLAMAVRIIPNEIPTPAQLHFEPVILTLAKLHDGLILVTGPSGSGKSTTAACMLEEINKCRKAHIVTIEDPIEFVFQSRKSLVVQREVGIDTHSFAKALRSVLRQDPNVIFIGEMRDTETILIALNAAETGHLVISTLHSPTASGAAERIVGMVEGSKQKQVLIQLSNVLKGVIAQKLLPSTTGGLVPIREILMGTPGIQNLIRENNIPSIKTAIQTGAKEGMMTFENSVQQWLGKGKITAQIVESILGRSNLTSSGPIESQTGAVHPHSR